LSLGEAATQRLPAPRPAALGIDAPDHLIAYVGFPSGLTAPEIVNDVVGSRG
jgi:hypothetical protein